MRYPRNVDVLLNMGGKLPDAGTGEPPVARSVKIIDVRIEASDIGNDYPLYAASELAFPAVLAGESRGSSFPKLRKE